uniref:Uncharacterized protein n=1 Tax=Oryza brachyantha TaxID=4533 RepID=J3MG30_ORYBR
MISLCFIFLFFFHLILLALCLVMQIELKSLKLFMQLFENYDKEKGEVGIG